MRMDGQQQDATVGDVVELPSPGLESRREPAPAVLTSAPAPPDVSVRDWYAAAELALRHSVRTGHTPVIAVLRLAERAELLSQRGERGLTEALAKVPELVAADLAAGELVAARDGGDLLLLLSGTSTRAVQTRLTTLTARLAVSSRLTPAIGWATADAHVSRVDLLVERAISAADIGAHQLDLVPRRWAPEQRTCASRLPDPLRTALQGVMCLMLGVVVPFLLLTLLYQAGIDLATPAYLLAVCVHVTAGTLIWVEGLHALDPYRPRAEPATDFPPASVLIAAYLPNEAATIIATLRAFLDHDYPGTLQVVLAYNTPQRLPVEAELRALAERDPRLVLLEVPFSHSKAQNINAALHRLEGEFTGVFDADHHPAPGAFARAWRSLSHGADVVQGHCVVRNGHLSWLSRIVAVEFETIYAVSHPGRSSLHAFGLFGGSNGFWRTSVLCETRMHTDMLTEDIDSSIRLLLNGRSLITDPALISRELAPVTVKALWAQRMRWAQGWFQVCRRHLATALCSPKLTRRNKVGVALLLGWREIYPWLSLQVIPVLAFLIWRAGGVSQLDWAVPVFVLTSLYTLSAGPGQVMFAWRLGAPEIKRHRWWFVCHLLVAVVAYTEFRNMVARIAQVKELMGERRWPCTPRHE